MTDEPETLAAAAAEDGTAGWETELTATGASALQPSAQVDLRVSPDAVKGRVALPLTPNTWLGGADVPDALWLGPDEWLFVALHRAASEVMDGLEQRLAGTHHSLVDVSANRVAFDLPDERRGLLEHGCGLDLHPMVWRDGMCAQTLLARAPVIIQQRTHATRVFVRPSFAGYVAAWLAGRAASDH